MKPLRTSRDAKAEYSKASEKDLAGIGAYTRRTWGETRTSRYLDEIEDCIEALAANPLMGRACDGIRPGMRRMEAGRHVIFYRIVKAGILVSRILHQRMLPQGRFH